MANTRYKTRSGTILDGFYNTIVQSNLKDVVQSAANSGQKDVVVVTGSNFAVNDSIIIYDGADLFETCVIASINSNTLTMTDNLTNTYPEGSVIGRYLGYLDTTNLKYQRLVAPDLGTGADGALNTVGNVTIAADKNYTSVTINNGHTVTISGNYQIKCQGTFEIKSGGKVSAKGYGHAGGNGGQYTGAKPGDSELGSGSGFGIWTPNGGAGQGAGGTGYSTSRGGGGGASYGGLGVSGNQYNNSPATQAGPGIVYNTAGLTTFTESYLKGSGGGGGGSSETGNGAGGAGGGIIRIHAYNFICAGEIDCDGNDGVTPGFATSYFKAGGGGGSGGTIFIQALNLATLGSGLIHSNGGAGGLGKATGSMDTNGNGGAGGVGRIRIEAGKITGTTTPTLATGYSNNMGGYTRYGWYHTAKVNVLNDSFVANCYVQQYDNLVANPSGSVSSGQKVIGLSAGNVAKLNAGQKVFIYENEKCDIGTIDTVGASSITLLDNLVYSYTTSAVVVRIDTTAQCSIVVSGGAENFLDMDLKEITNVSTNLWQLTFSKAIKSTNLDSYGKEFIGRVRLEGKDNDAVDVYVKEISWSYF